MTKEIIKPDYSLDRDEMMEEIFDELELERKIDEILERIGEWSIDSGSDYSLISYKQHVYSTENIKITKRKFRKREWKEYKIKWKSKLVLDFGTYVLDEDEVVRDLNVFIYCDWMKELFKIYNNIDKVETEKLQKKMTEEKRRRYKNFRIDC